MIGNFPTLYPDELFYSACARYQERTPYPSAKGTLLEMFGSVCTSAVDLPCRLGDFAAMLPEGHSYTADRMIRSHTLYPLFRPFLPPARADALRDDMKGAGGLVIHRRSGVMASRIPLPERLRFCPVCRGEDQERFGETYWHRIHQIPGVLVCPAHEVFLQTSPVFTTHSRNRHRFVTAEESTGIAPAEGLDYSNGGHLAYLNIARGAQWLLAQGSLYSTPDGIRNRYLRLLISLGFAGYSGCLYAEKLAAAIYARFDAAQLERLHCSFTGRDRRKDNWILRLFRRPKHSQHPLRHLVAVEILGTTVESFFGLPAELEFFGTGPWPCLNKAAAHYRERVVTACRVTHRGRRQRPVGTFACACGFVYSRTGPDEGAGDRFRIGRMKAFGRVWEAKLKQLWDDPSLCRTEVARRLGVDPLTVQRHAARLGLPSDRPGQNVAAVKSTLLLRTKRTPEEQEKILTARRCEWLLAMKRSPRAALKAVRLRFPRLYTWLRKHDPEWLKNNLPFTHEVRRKKAASVDWEKRDTEFEIMMRGSAAKLRLQPGKPRRITKTAIARDLGQVTLLQQKLSKLPRTAAVLSSVVESPVEFALRRIRRAADAYIRAEEIPKRWELIQKANVYRLRDVPAVRQAIDRALADITSENYSSAGKNVA
ncbi:MAG TPA: TnsD family transposase [Pyrinomonadaceae bacterium]|nr:TnsD family transposase [Pyrinomonadaceae bacterium]